MVILLGCSKDDEKTGIDLSNVECYACTAYKDGQPGTLRHCGTPEDLQDFKKRMKKEGFNIIECKLDDDYYFHFFKKHSAGNKTFSCRNIVYPFISAALSARTFSVTSSMGGLWSPALTSR